ncbi:MAG TPA: SMEK domain-containing protein [Schlesneria sp.]|jgi:hypothetical protein
MLLSRENAIKTITAGISWIATEVQLRGAIHLFDANIILEQVFRCLLNEMYDLDLVVTENIQPNFPAIDLGDEINKRAFQVTAESTSAKIQATLNSYAGRNLTSQYGKLQVIVIGERQRTYKKLQIPSGLDFTWEDDIIDTKCLIQTLNSLETEKLQRLTRVIQQELNLPGSRNVRVALEKMKSRFLRASHTGLINGTFIARREVQDIVDTVSSEDYAGVLLIAAAGFGKSCILTQVLTLTEEHFHIAAFKLDSVPECATADRLGRELELDESPVTSLAQLAPVQPALLVIDQLDAISTVSGRKTGTWEALDEILTEARKIPRLKVVLACRDFDLNQDHRLRQLSAEGAGYKKIVVSKLADTDVEVALETAGLAHFKLTATQLEILSLPFHLLLFLQGYPDRPFSRVSDLFNAYWDRKLDQTRLILGHEPRWNQVIDVLTQHMSENQCTFAPAIILDDLAKDANLMASAHVLIREDLAYRFFHESFFDYAYARRFCSLAKSLVNFLSSDEQHLFRRAQVRQILSFRRENDLQMYLKDLSAIFASENIRFHLKRMVASELHRIATPILEEWEIAQTYLFDTDLAKYILGAVRRHEGWFDLLDGIGVWDKWLASDSEQQINVTLSIIEDTELQKLRSTRIAELIKPYAASGGDWDNRLKRVLSWGGAYLSDGMAQVYFELIKRGVYDVEDDPRGGRDFWGDLYEASENRPTFIVDVLRVWFLSVLEKYDDGASWNFLDKCPINGSHSGCQMIATAASSDPIYFLEKMLPIFVDTCISTQFSQLDRLLNRTWPWLNNSDDPFDINDAILVHLRRVLEHEAQNNVRTFRQIIEPLKEFQHESICYLLLCGYAANPQELADECLHYILSHKPRLNIGYGSWSGGRGHGESAISRTAIQAVSSFCSDSLLRDLEDAIVGYSDEYERTTIGQRGFGELLVLRSIDPKRRSKRANIRIHELECSFPNVGDEIPSASEGSIARWVGPPISSDRAHLMNDAQWISAMQKYNGSTDRFEGGPQELSQVLRESARKNRIRFANLAMKMPIEICPEYFDAILDGMTSKYLNIPTDEKAQDDKNIAELNTGLLHQLIYRLHSLPNRPCGTSIVHCIGRMAERELQAELLDVVSYYAEEDPDPSEDFWRRPDRNHYGRDPYHQGINCVRGQAAMAISHLLFADESRITRFRKTLASLTHDKMLSVRSCAIRTLTPLLNFARDEAVAMFVDCCHNAERLWSTVPFQEFVRHAIHSHYLTLRPLLLAAMNLEDAETVEKAATEIILADLAAVDTVGDADLIRSGTENMRKAASHVYAVNIGNSEIGDRAAHFLQDYINDPCEEVRKKVPRAFWHIDGKRLLALEPLILKFTESKSFEADPNALLRSLEESKAELPHVVCRAAERVLEFVGEEGASIANHAASAAHSVSKLIVRLYAQTRDTKLKLRCLDLIDRMERIGYLGISDELEKIDR